MHFIGFIDKNRLSKLYTLKYYKNCLNDLIGNGINVLYFFYDDKEIDINKQTRKKLDDIGIKILGYKDYKDIINYLKKIKGPLFINTFQENQILMTSKLKSDLGQKVTENYELFLNKFLQRDILGSKYPETITGYKIVKKSKNLENIKLKYPIIVKPVGGIQSSGTFKVSNNLELKNAVNNIYNNVLPKLRNKGLLESDIILEEYIDGDMYTIDYFVDEDQNITRPSPVKILLGTDYGINDFSNIVRILSNQVQNKINNNKLDVFIQKTIEAGGFKNTFIHHEFKINSQGEYKTIETNGRIGGYRLEMHEEGNNINILKYPFIEKGKKIPNIKIDNNIAIFALYPNKNCVFYGYNESLLDEITKLKSFFRINKGDVKIGTRIGLTRDGFGKIGTIVLKNKSNEQFKKDLKFLNKNYFNILEIK